MLALPLILVGACGRPSDIFLPVIVGERTATPILLETPNATPTALPATATSPPATALPTVPVATAVARVPTRVVTVVVTRPGSGPVPAATATPAPTTTPPTTPTTTPTTIFRRYLAQIVAQLQPSPTPTATPRPVPIVLTPTPRPATATATGTPTYTPTPFTGSIRLLARDPVYEDDVVPVIAYVENESRIDKSWSSFYATQPRSSEQVRIYASERARVYDPLLALTSTDQWAEGVCMAPSTMVGVQFWGDENDGWARVLVDGIERWRGNTYGRAPELFVRFLEIRDLPAAPHVIRIEPIGQAGTTLAGGNIHVSIYAVVCGLPVESEIFMPILQR
jgi:hypothetical protein